MQNDINTIKKLFTTVENGQLEIVNQLLKQKVDLNVRNESKDTLLHVAVKKCHVATMIALISAGANVNAKDKNGKTPLQLAVTQDYIEGVRELLKIDAVKAAATADENYALHMAAKKGSVEIIRELLKINAVRKAVTSHKNYALRIAAERGHIEVVRELLKIATVKADATAEGNYALCFAADSGHIEVVRELLAIAAVRAGANVGENYALRKAVAKGYVDIVRELLAVDVVRATAAIDENYVLYKAAKKGHVEIVIELLKINAVRIAATANENGALRAAAENGHIGTVRELLTLEAVREAAAIDENYALHSAAENGHIEIVRELLTIETVREAATAKRNYMLCLAAENGHIEIVRELLTIKAVREAAAIDKNYALHLAAENGHIEIVRELLTIEAVREAATAKGNYALCLAAENGHIETVQELLTIKAVREAAAIDENYALHLAAKNGHIEVARELLAIEAVREAATAKNNYPLRLAAENGYIEIVRELLTIKAVREAAAINENDALCSAAENGHFETVRELLTIEAVREAAAIDENYALCSAAQDGHFETVRELLTIEAVREAVAIDGNYALCLAAENGHIEVVRELLAIDAVRESAPTEGNYALCVAAQNGHIEVVRELLAIEAVKAAATTSENYALRLAAKNGHIEIVRELLAIDAVRAAATAEGNYALCYAAAIGHTEIVKMLIAIPQVSDYLLRSDGKELIKLLKTPNKITQLIVLNQLTIYGISLAQIMDKRSKTLIEDIQYYCMNPEDYLEHKTNYSLNQIQAVKLLKAHLDVANYEQMQQEARWAMEQQQNPDDEGKIAAVLKHFENVIKPAFKNKFKNYGTTKTECLESIESDIRVLLLNRMVKDLQGRLQNENNIDEVEKHTLISAIDFINKHFDRLKSGQDKNLMAQARDYFCSINDNNQIAWRAYDKWAPCVKQWPNLLTPPLNKEHEKAFTVGVLGEHDITSASARVRELAAYSFLVVMDENDGDDATRLNRIENFIGQIKDIRRAHNLDEDKGMDNASCFPGSVGRVGTMWSMHSLALTKKMTELLPEIFRSIIAKKFSTAIANCDTQEQKDDLYYSLVMLRKENAQEVINQEAEFYDNPAWARKRQDFIDNIGSLGEIEKEINLTLTEMRSEDVLTPEQYIYLVEYLADIGGGRFAEMLTSIYHQHASEMEIETIFASEKISNPFAVNAMMRRILSDAQLQRQEQLFIAWEIVFPILEKNFSTYQGLAELAEMIARDWARNKENGLTGLEFSTFTQEELNRVDMNSAQCNAIDMILQEYKDAFIAAQINKIDEVGGVKLDDDEMEDDNLLNPENTLMFNRTILGKRTKISENNDDDELTSNPKRSKKDNV